MASRGETCSDVADAGPITGSWSTVHFVFKYSKDLLIKPGITDTDSDMQDKITNWATSMTSKTVSLLFSDHHGLISSATEGLLDPLLKF